MTIGDVNGIMEPQNTRPLSGDLYANIAMKKPIISGIVNGSISCWLSASFSTAEPIAAKRDAYNRYPKTKKRRKTTISWT